MSLSRTLYDPELKTGKTWYIEYYDPKRKRIAKTHQGIDINSIENEDERRKVANEFIAHLKTTFPKIEAKTTKPTTLISALNFVIDVNRHWKPGTLRSYRNISRLFGEWLQTEKKHHIAPNSFTSEMAQQYFDHLLVKKGYSNTTYNNHRRTLALLFKAIKKRGFLKKNVIESVDYLRKVDTTRRPFRQDEEMLVMAAVWNDQPLRFAYIALRYFAVRPDEIRSVTCGQFDFQRGLLYLPSSNSKNSQTTGVTIPLEIVEALKELGVHRLPAHNYVLCHADEKPTSKVIIGKTPYQIGKNFISTRFRSVLQGLKKAGMIHSTENLCFYSLKYTLTADMISQGIDVKTAMDHLRLNDVSSFQRYLKRTGVIHPAIQKMSITIPH